MMSRRKTREYLLQLLYARATQHDTFDRDIFDVEFFEEEDFALTDPVYVKNLDEGVLAHERELLDITAALAPKFELESMPVIHIIIIMIALAEMLGYAGEEIPESVSANEAVELAKRFSDSQGKNFINGTLATFLKDRPKLLLAKKEGTYKIF